MSALIAYISLGSNLGDSRSILLAAMSRLRQFSDEPVVCSSLWQTAPVDCPPGSPPFLNAVVGIHPRVGESSLSLLYKLRALETEFGRQPKQVLNEPRLLDLDLICFGSEICHTPELILPHPRAHLRKFVLQPLSEIDPNYVLPDQTKTVLQLLSMLPPGEVIGKL